MVWMYRKDVFDANRDRMQQDLGFDPMPNDGSTWEQYYETAKWLTQEQAGRHPVRLRASGQAARLADERLLQRAVGLRRRLLRRRRQRRALRLRRPGRAAAGHRRGDRRRRHVPQAALGRASLLAELGLDGPGRGVPGRPVRDGRRVARVRRRLRDVQDRGQGRLRAAAQGPEAPRVHVRRHRDRHQRHVVRGRAEGGVAVRELGDVAGDAAGEPQEQGRRRDADARVDLRAARGQGGA